MRSWLTTLALATVVVSGGATLDAAPAAATAYPPVNREVTASPNIGEPGYTVTVTARCDPGEDVRIQLGERSVSAACTESGLTALAGSADDLRGYVTTEIDAPLSPGGYRGTAEGARSGPLGGFVVRVETTVAARASIGPVAGDSVEWGQVFRYSSFGTMFIAFFAVLLLLRRRLQVT